MVCLTKYIVYMKQEATPNMVWGETFTMQAFMTIHGINADDFKTVPYTNHEGQNRLMLSYSSSTEEDGVIPICSDIELNSNNQLVAEDTKQVLSAANIRISKCITTDPETGEVSSTFLLHRYYPAKSGIKCSLFA